MGLILLRHTITNSPVGTVYGQSDVGLGENAIQDIENAVNQLKVVPDRIISSPLQRCLRLAEYLANRRSVKLSIDPRLMELNFGLWEGQRWNDLAGPELDHWMANFVRVAPPQGESYSQLAERVSDAWNDYQELAQTETVLWVTHLGVARALRAQMGHFTLEDSFSWKLPFGTTFSL